MKAWSRIMNIPQRVAWNYQATNTMVPPLYGLRKDHKAIPPGDESKGPPQRPVCGAVVSCNYRISHFLSSIIRPIIEMADEPCNSTEDLLSRIQEVNENEDLEGCIIGSMDVKALYPSIDIDFAVEKCKELIFESQAEFKNVDTEELGLYLALCSEEGEIEREGLADFCPVRKKKGKRPTITASGTNSNDEKRWQSWTKSNIKPNSIETRKMVVAALGIAMKTTLKNHIFTFNGEIRKQESGGAIGVAAAGDIACLFMVWWDRAFNDLLGRKDIEMKLYSRYVDDDNIACKSIPIDDENQCPNDDERTMKRLQTIGNSIHPSVQLTVDFPSANDNNRIPVLDTEQWMEEVEVNGSRKLQILHSHYSKPISNKYVIHRSSALPMRSKMNILVSDLVRIMKNISVMCPPEERKSKIQEFVDRMQYSGYTKSEKATVYKRAKMRYEKALEDSNSGLTPLYRSKKWNRNERRNQKEQKRTNWFRNDGSDAVFFVEATPNGELAEACQKEFKDAGLKVKVVERSGSAIKRSIVRSNPFKKKSCERNRCEVCENHELDCKTREVVYRISCIGTNKTGEICQGVFYEGDTSRSIGERFPEHAELMKSTEESTRKRSFIYEHAKEEHNGRMPPVKVEVVAQCHGDPGLRQAMEAVRIRELKPPLNGKEEWTNQPRKRKKNTGK